MSVGGDALETTLESAQARGRVRWGVMDDGTAGMLKTNQNIAEARKFLDVKVGDLRRMIERSVKEYVDEQLTKFDSEASVRAALSSRVDVVLRQKLGTLERELAAAIMVEVRKRAAEMVASLPLVVTVGTAPATADDSCAADGRPGEGKSTQ